MTDLEVFNELPPDRRRRKRPGSGRSQMMRDACDANPGKWVRVPGHVPNGTGGFWLLRREGYRVVQRRQDDGTIHVYMSKPVEDT